MNHDIVTVQSLLQELGYSAAEGEVMWALLNLENVSVRKVSDYSGINRGTAYEAIKKLAAAGLVSVQKRGEREYFSAESPEKLLDIIRDKRKDLLQTQEHAAKLIPELLARGKPVIATVTPGAIDIMQSSRIGRNDFGYLVEPNANSVADAMEWMLHHPADVTKMRKNALERSKEYHWEASAEEFDRLYRA